MRRTLVRTRLTRPGQARPWRTTARGEIIIAISLPAGRFETGRSIGALTVGLLRIADLRGNRLRRTGWPCGLAESAGNIPVLVVPCRGVTILAVGALAIAIAAVAVLAVAGLRVSTRARGLAEAVLGRGVLAGAADLRRGLLVRDVWPQLTLASVLVVAGHTATFVIAARLAGSTAPLGELIALLMVIQIAAGIPLSIGGWGPREGAAAWAFAAAGLGAANGVTVSTLYAVLMLAAVTPGAGLLLRDAVRRRRGREHPGESTGPDPAPPMRHPAWRGAERLVP